MHHRTVKNGQQNAIYIKYGALIMILLLKMASESTMIDRGCSPKVFTENVWIFTKNTSQEHRQLKAVIIFSLEGKCL